MSAPVIARIVWDGIAVEVIYHKRRWNSELDHIELYAENRQILPVTETGYRSHFLPGGIVEEYGGAEGFVRAWLEHEAESSDWKKRASASRQMTLF